MGNFESVSSQRGSARVLCFTAARSWQVTLHKSSVGPCFVIFRSLADADADAAGRCLTLVIARDSSFTHHPTTQVLRGFGGSDCGATEINRDPQTPCLGMILLDSFSVQLVS